VERLRKETHIINVYAGFDPREEVGFHTFASSLIHHSSEPLSITPLHLKNLAKVYQGGQRDGTNAFIFSRFLIPYLQNYQGWALFMDGADMIVKGDIAELWALRNPFVAVQVVPHKYKTKHPLKYVGTGMEAANNDYPRKNWSSMMLINCSHYAWRRITPEAVESMSGSDLHSFSFIPERYIDFLPAEWNWLADEFGENKDAKVLHWTAGIPAWPHYQDAPHADDWAKAAVQVTHAIS
jgi:lipopolysaccharide biosynthesis glycosyltransferase